MAIACRRARFVIGIVGLSLASAASTTLSCGGSSHRSEGPEPVGTDQTELAQPLDTKDLKKLNRDAIRHGRKQANEAHARLLSEEGPYISAAKCGECHPDHYREWAVSPHAYALLSPVFNAMQGKILQLTNGTTGDFCIRCHTPVGMELGERIFDSSLNRHPVSREGITCIVCHRVQQSYGKNSGRLKLHRPTEGETGDIFESIYGPSGNAILKDAIASGTRLTSTPGIGRPVHADIKQADHLRASSFCGICHDVNLNNGFRLEEAFSEYKTSPAAARGVSCQDCHMGYDPGVPDTYRHGVAAHVEGLELPSRKRTNHRFIGPDYSVIHPGLFPHNPNAVEVATMEDWLTFDWKAGWGTPEFEAEAKNNPDNHRFPPRWSIPRIRKKARDVIEDNLKLLAEAQAERIKLLALGYQLGEIAPLQADDNGIGFTVEVRNGTDGHGVPTGFDAERVVFLQVTVTDRDGVAVMKSGDLDPNGDLRDLHSLYVHDHELPLDTQLFSLQSKFITRNVRGGEREQVLAVNTSLSALRFLRPSTFSTILTGRPLGVRKHKQNLAPHDSTWAVYRVSASALTGNGPYLAEVLLIAGMVPVNLVAEIKDAGFDYNMSPRTIADTVVYGLDGRIQGTENAEKDYGGHTILHKRQHIFAIHSE